MRDRLRAGEASRALALFQLNSLASGNQSMDLKGSWYKRGIKMWKVEGGNPLWLLLPSCISWMRHSSLAR